LLLSILEDLRGEDIRTVDLGWGDIQLRECLGSDRQVEARVHIYAPNLRGIKLSLLSTGMNSGVRGVKSLLRYAHGEKWVRRTLSDWMAR